MKIALTSQNSQRPLFHVLCLSCGLIEARLKIRATMLPSHIDGGFHVASQHDELGWPPVVVAAKTHGVDLSHSGRQNSGKPRLEQKGAYCGLNY